MMRIYIYVISVLVLLGCAVNPETKIEEVPQWTTYEISLNSDTAYANNYTDIQVAATFENERGERMIRPGFWDGGSTWKIRFSPPDTASTWTWITECSDGANTGLHKQEGSLRSVPYRGDNALLSHGLLTMSPGKRNVIHADGHPFLVVGDTPWALPFRATPDQARIYAEDRQQKGFNAALLMTVQPDMDAKGPQARNTEQGFMRGFDDLSDGHLNEIDPSYYQTLDTLMEILLEHEIVPVYQPVFHGFGWKGLRVLGNYVEPEEYVRYCQYLLARYGSKPAFWLLAGDNGGRDPGVRESGVMMEQWDAYQQPTGLHYNPCDDYIAPWAIDNPIKHCEHYNKTFQAEPWLDFQWAQTGHGDEHLYHKVERMYENKPTKASANGEPTYEGMNAGKNGLGWWQGEEAWMQLMSGGTMGVVYGAASLWQWKVTPDEEGWPEWTDQPLSWEDALDMEGSTYVGLVEKAFHGFDYTDMEKRPDLTPGEEPLLSKEGEFYVSYLDQGGEITIRDVPHSLECWWFNPKTGEQLKGGKVNGETFSAPDQEPWVLLIGSKVSG